MDGARTPVREGRCKENDVSGRKAQGCSVGAGAKYRLTGMPTASASSPLDMPRESLQRQSDGA